MIATEEFDLPLHIKRTRCANGETMEYRLMLGDEQVGRSVYRSQETDAARVALQLLRTLTRDQY